MGGLWVTGECVFRSAVLTSRKSNPQDVGRPASRGHSVLQEDKQTPVSAAHGFQSHLGSVGQPVHGK